VDFFKCPIFFVIIGFALFDILNNCLVLIFLKFHQFRHFDCGEGAPNVTALDLATVTRLPLLNKQQCDQQICRGRIRVFPFSIWWHHNLCPNPFVFYPDSDTFFFLFLLPRTDIGRIEDNFFLDFFLYLLPPFSYST
jgi:hypothetical protein